ncbi:MAG TPA: hypothetical protein VHX44_05965 [Planctomycetota bacterium]|nr:hypothetical protein [Planctomycetota bacterium]
MSPDPAANEPTGDDLSSSTSLMTSQAHEHERLIMRYLAGERDADLLKRLSVLVDDDAELRDELRDELALDRILRQHGRMPLDPAPVMTAIVAHGHSARLSDQVMAGIAAAQKPLMAPRPWWIAAAVAASVLITALVTTLWYGQGASTPVIESQPFASVHYIRNVQWPADLLTPPVDGARIAPGAVTLNAGVIELRFDNGVVLALEGPAQVDLWSRMQAHLRSGRLTTNVPPMAHGFTVQADHMRVVDLGTEVGIDLARDGRAHVQVYTGAAEIALSDAVASPAETRIAPGEARSFDPATGAVASAVFDAARFVRTGPRRMLALSVSDLIGGGDGRGTAAMDGLDPVSGALQSGVVNGGVAGNSAYHRLADVPFIDGVFMPVGGSPMQVSSAGHRYLFDLEGGHTYDLIRRGGFIIKPPDGGGVTVPTPSPSVIGGLDHGAFGHHLIGMHASSGFTIDLKAIAEAYGQLPVRFTTAVANTAPRRVAPALAAVPADKAVIADPVPWAVLEPRTVTAVAGTVLTPQSDSTVVAWPIKHTDTYTVSGTPTVRRLSAIRLEVLSDPALPSKGPGASPNGNFILTRIKVAVITATDRREIVLTGAVADFNQEKWHVTNAIGNDDTAGWAVVPETGRSHWAVFYCNPIDLPADAQVEVTLSQLNRRYLDHLIGKFRLSLTGAADPVRGVAVGGGSFVVLIDGKLQQRTVVPLSDQAPARVDVPLNPTDRFLTLVSSDGGYGTAYQWNTLGDPRIELAGSQASKP